MEYIDVIIKCPVEYADKVESNAKEMIAQYLESIQIETAKDEYQVKISEGKAEDIVGDYKVSVGIIEDKVEPVIEPVIEAPVIEPVEQPAEVPLEEPVEEPVEEPLDIKG